MQDEIKKEILYDLQQALQILEQREDKDIEELGKLSDHAVQDVALYKDLELVSITVLLYSLYKVGMNLSKEDYRDVLKELKSAQDTLQQGALGRYNRYIQSLFQLVKKSNAKIKEHLDDVMQAARIKKGTSLLQRGLSIGQAAGIMGLSNWDLQQYAGKTTALEQHTEKIPGDKRVRAAFKLFGVS